MSSMISIESTASNALFRQSLAGWRGAQRARSSGARIGYRIGGQSFRSKTTTRARGA